MCVYVVYVYVHIFWYIYICQIVSNLYATLVSNICNIYIYILPYIPSRELTYPPKMAFWKYFPIPKVGYVSSLEGMYLEDTKITSFRKRWSEKSRTGTTSVLPSPSSASVVAATDPLLGVVWTLCFVGPIKLPHFFGGSNNTDIWVFP